MDSDAAAVLRRLRLRLDRIAAHRAEIETERSQFDAEVTALAQRPGWTIRGIARELGFPSDTQVRRARTRAQARTPDPGPPRGHVTHSRSRDRAQH